MIGGQLDQDWEPYPDTVNRHKPEVATSGGQNTYSESRTKNLTSTAEAQKRWLDRVAGEIRAYNREQQRRGDKDRKVIDEFGLAHVTAKEFRELLRESEFYHLFDPGR